ncbi:BrnA antitoxin family protein [Acidisoma sp. 7E03]
MSGKPKLIRPRAEADAAIRRGIEQGLDNPELSESFSAIAQSASAELRGRHRVRGPQKAPIKVSVSIRLDRELVERLRASGPGWQSRVNELLRRSA